jgi:TetR/AcrR family transcriptional regulator, mexJK operon transcriptional repressor
MNKRIHLPPDERREQIVRGALEVFGEKGFDATTNKEIARVAGIASPGLIYHYFKDKIDLLRAVIEMQVAERMKDGLPDRLMGMSLEEGLREIIRRPMENVDDPTAIAFTRVLMGESMRRPEFAKILSDVMISRMFTLLTAFLRRHQEAGNLRDVNVTVTAMRFTGSIASIFLMREVLRIPAVRELSIEEIERGLVEDFLRGVAPGETNP